MSTLQHLIESGIAIQIAIGLILVEISVIMWFRRQVPRAVILGLAPGLCLMLALLTALKGGDWRMIAFWVTVSLPFHLIDLRARLGK
jgi:hypothetical protein